MDPNSGRIYDVVDADDARKRGWIPFGRALTEREQATRQVRFCDPCACGSGKKFKRCCYMKWGRAAVSASAVTEGKV